MQSSNDPDKLSVPVAKPADAKKWSIKTFQREYARWKGSKGSFLRSVISDDAGLDFFERDGKLLDPEFVVQFLETLATVRREEKSCQSTDKETSSSCASVAAGGEAAPGEVEGTATASKGSTAAAADEPGVSAAVKRSAGDMVGTYLSKMGTAADCRSKVEFGVMFLSKADKERLHEHLPEWKDSLLAV